MALYERFVDGAKVARAFTVDGSDEDTRLARLAADGVDGWQRVGEVAQPVPKTSGRKRPAQAETKEM